jgi:hypothetical protein
MDKKWSVVVLKNRFIITQDLEAGHGGIGIEWSKGLLVTPDTYTHNKYSSVIRQGARGRQGLGYIVVWIWIPVLSLLLTAGSAA